MSRHKARLDAIEGALAPKGKVHVIFADCGEGDTGLVNPVRLAEVRATMGPDDQLILVEYTHDWKAEQEQEAR